jgi:hypothetical protein
MAIDDEKAEVERTSHETPKIPNRPQAKDTENKKAGYLPQSDEEYNVTLKTWCVVAVSEQVHLALTLL